MNVVPSDMQQRHVRDRHSDVLEAVLCAEPDTD